MLGRLRSLFGRGTEEKSTDSDDDSEDEGGFLRSRLDKSVLESHAAGGGIETDTEMDDVDDQVRELQEQMPDQEHIDPQYNDGHR